MEKERKQCRVCGKATKNSNAAGTFPLCNFCKGKLLDEIYTAWMEDEPKRKEK